MNDTLQGWPTLASPRPKRVNVSLQPTGLTAWQKRWRPNTNSQDRMSDCPVAALRFTHGHFDPSLPAPPAQQASSEAGDVVCQGGHVAAGYGGHAGYGGQV